MKEFEQGIPDWKKQLDGARFYDKRKGDINDIGHQFTVFTRPGMDFVVKVPLNPLWMRGYKIVEENAPELAIPFQIAENIALNVNYNRTIIPEAILQEKVIDSQTALVTATDSDTFMPLITGISQADRALFSRGIFVPDPTPANFGAAKDGSIKIIDLGSARQSFGNNGVPEDMEYTNLARCRAAIHISFYLLLRDSFIYDPGETPLHLIYAQELGLSEPDSRLANYKTLMDYYNYVYDPEIDRYLTQYGHEEFQKFAPGGAPFELNEEYLKDVKGNLRRLIGN